MGKWYLALLQSQTEICALYSVWTLVKTKLCLLLNYCNCMISNTLVTEHLITKFWQWHCFKQQTHGGKGERIAAKKLLHKDCWGESRRWQTKCCLWLQNIHICKEAKPNKRRHTLVLISISQLIKGASVKHQGLLPFAWIIHCWYPLLKPVTSSQWFPAQDGLLSEMTDKLQQGLQLY